MEDKEFLQYIKETGFNDLLDIDKKNIGKIKNTLHYNMWELEKAYKKFAEEMRKTRIGSIIISIIEFLNKCVEKIF